MIPWTPIRKGRMAGQGGWQEQYRALRMTPAGAAALVRDGDTVVMTRHHSVSSFC